MYWHSFRALTYRTASSFRTKWIVLSIFILIAILCAVLLKLQSLNNKTPPRNFPAIPTQYYDESQFSGTGPEQVTMVASPEKDAKDLLAGKPYFTEVTYNDTAAGVEETVHAQVEKDNNTRNSPRRYGLVIGEYVVDKFSYTLRYHDENIAPTSQRYETGWGNGPEYLHYGSPLHTQINIDEAFIRRKLRKSLKWRLASMPVPERNKTAEQANGFPPAGLRMLSSFLTMGATLLLVQFALVVIRDKLSGVKEILHMKGIPKWMIDISWLAAFGLLFLILGFIITVVLFVKPNVLPWVSPVLFATFLILFYWASLSSVHLITAFITSARLGGTVIIVYWLGSWILVSITISKFEESLAAQILVALLPTGAIMQFEYAYQDFRGGDTILNFSNMLAVPLTASLPVGILLLEMVATIVLYSLLAAYADAVKPGPWGRAKPWYLFTRRGSEVRPADKDIASSSFFEDIGSAEVSIEVSGLYKKFGNFTAVNNLNLKILKNKITVLLGHNGAGKTTFFSMITGMFSPTRGNVYCEGDDIFDGENFQKFRNNMGYCPQSDLLFDDLTVQNHLIMFGILKGLSCSEAKQQSWQWLKMFELYIMRNKRVRQLSGGMKRKLSLAIAMTGNPNVLLLDEPTSGLDPQSRRAVWNVLLSVKGSSTIIVTTHSMEEAEVLNDRIALMASGKLVCYGSSMFLKKKYGFGYQLNVNVEALKSDSIERVEKTVHQYAPANERGRTDKTIMYDLPASHVQEIPQLLRDLEGRNIQSTLNYSTVDDVFLRVQQDEGVEITVQNIPASEEGEKPRKINIFQQLIGLWILRVKWIMRNWLTCFVLVWLLPLVAAIVSVLLMSSTMDLISKGFVHTEGSPPLLLSLSSYKLSNALIYGDPNNPVTQGLVDVIQKSGTSYEMKPPVEDVSSELMNLGKQNLYLYKSTRIVAFDTGGPTPTAYFSTSASHAAPIAYSTLINALLLGSASITTRTRAIEHHVIEEGSPGESFQCLPFIHILILILVIPVLGTALGLMSIYFVILPHISRTTQFRHLQLITGIFPVVYWFSFLIFDLLLYSCSAVLIVLVIFVSDTTGFLSSPTVLPFLALILFLYGLSGIAFSYFASLWFGKVENCMMFFVLISIFLTFASGLLADIWTQWKLEYSNFLPWSALIDGIIEIVRWEHMCEKCGGACKNTPLGEKLMPCILWLLVDAVVYFVIVCLKDFGICSVIGGLIQGWYRGQIPEKDALDDDVKAEKERVRFKLQPNELQQGEDRTVFVCDSLGKKFSGGRTAVKDVTFAVTKGECFGMLGVNGAGKSTTFGMLTGTISPTKGAAMINGEKLSKIEALHNYRYLRQLGYCPQTGGLLLDLSAKDLISHFARLRGVSPKEISTLTQKWITALEMDGISRRPCKTYSGGNKRKLSLTLSLVGNPPLVLLDEPTTGVDVVVMRKIWQILKYCLQQNGQTVILTSHSMTECEAVCGRLTVMVSGEMRCIGAVPMLKKKYAHTCVVNVKLKNDATRADMEAVKNAMDKAFQPYAFLQDQQPGFLTFTINTQTIRTHKVFDMMLRMKSKEAAVEDFSVSDASLEQVFLSFARE